MLFMLLQYTLVKVLWKVHTVYNWVAVQCFNDSQFVNNPDHMSLQKIKHKMFLLCRGLNKQGYKCRREFFIN